MTLPDPDLPTIDDIRTAAGRIAAHAVRTPLLARTFLDDVLGAQVFVKCETLQRTGSFKFRGAYNALAALGREGREKGIVAISSGNHAQGVAEAARLFGCAATIVMPADAPAIKRARTERSGARVVTYDRAVEDREMVAARIIAEEGGALDHPYNDPMVIAGQGTIGLEIAEDMAAAGVAPDAVFIPCGGGGLSAGTGLALSNRFPRIEIHLAEPRGFDDYGRSLREGRIVRNEASSGSVMDALLAPAPGAIGFAINRMTGAGGKVVTDEEALAAVAFAFRELKLVVEPGGAAGLAAALASGPALRGRTIVILLSGGNIDEATLKTALDSNLQSV
jgi:threonine dehydratase